MKKALYRLAVLAVLVAVLAGIEAFTAIDVPPGFDLGTIQTKVAEAIDVPDGVLPDESSSLPSVDFPGQIPPRAPPPPTGPWRDRTYAR